jgi:hypothetical protein
MPKRLKNVRTVKCPGCGLPVVMEDATCTVRHASPICAVFEAKIKACGLKPRFEPWEAVVLVQTAKAAR